MGRPFATIPRLCSVDNCGKAHEAKGLCRSHYDKGRAKNPERMLATRAAIRRWDLANPEKRRIIAKRHRETNLKNKFRNIRGCARARNISFVLVYEDYLTAVVGNNCNYCAGELPLTGGGLDRLDHKRGYEMANVVPCCKSCNLKKGRLEGVGFRYPRTAQLIIELVSDKLFAAEIAEENMGLV